MPYINVRGVEHYYEWVKKSSGSLVKPVMVFMHGWAGSARYWQNTADVLSEQFDCLLYDLRGFGRSGGKPTIVQASEAVAESQSSQEESEAIRELTYELEEYADDLAAFLDGLHIVYSNTGDGREAINCRTDNTSIFTTEARICLIVISHWSLVIGYGSKIKE